MIKHIYSCGDHFSEQWNVVNNRNWVLTKYTDAIYTVFDISLIIHSPFHNSYLTSKVSYLSHNSSLTLDMSISSLNKHVLSDRHLLDFWGLAVLVSCLIRYQHFSSFSQEFKCISQFFMMKVVFSKTLRGKKMT